MAEQASQTKTALQLQTVSVDFGSRSQRAMTYNFSAQAAGKKKKQVLSPEVSAATKISITSQLYWLLVG